MNKEEMWKALHFAVEGERGKKSSTISEYEKMTPEAGYIKAQAYLKSAKRGQENCRSDWAYWGWESDIAIAKTLINVFTALKADTKEFPKLNISNEGMLM